MTPEAIALALIRKPSLFAITIGKDSKVFKTCAVKVRKECFLVGLFSEYANLPAVRTAITAGTREEPVLPKHIKQSVVIGGTRFWEGHAGKFYLPVPLSDIPTQTKWFLDEGEGYKHVPYADVEGFLLASEKPQPRDKESLAEKGQAPFVAISVENIISVSKD